jgi:L,D-transpeptidase catalytic domain
MQLNRYTQNALIGAAAIVLAGSQFLPGHDTSGPVLATVSTALAATPARDTVPAGPAAAASSAPSGVAGRVTAALEAFSGVVRPLSHPAALQDAFRSYFAFRSAHPDEVRKPYLYFVDYGLPSTEARGYVFDMDSLKIIDGPFTVAHGRGSSSSHYGVPTRFSNAARSAATSLGLYLTKSLYDFTGHSGGQAYSSIGLRLEGESGKFNDNAFARGVVAHGAPYVTSDKAGRSEGCPAMEPNRAERLLPKLADGAMVFLFAPDANWLTNDPWLN